MCELTDPLDVIEAIDEWQDAGGRQIPLVGFVAVKVLDEYGRLVGSNGKVIVLVVADDAEGDCCAAL